MGICTSLLRQLVGGVFGAWTLWRQGPPRISDFHHAILKNDIQKITQLMQENPLFVNAIYNEETAFSRALDYQHLDAAIAIMESAHFDPDAVNQMRKTALNSCVQHRVTDDFIPRLLAMGADPNIPDKRGHTPLMCCTSYDNHKAAQDLLNYGADPDKGDPMDYTPLYRACCYASVNTVDVLISYGCDVNKVTKDLQTPLMAALPSSRDVQIDRNNIVSDTLLICDMLVAAGCDINAQDKYGKTALHHCVDMHDLFGLCFLAEKGCDLSVKDNKGYTALQTPFYPENAVTK